MFCPNCEMHIPKNAHFCPSCSSKISDRFSESPQVGPGGHLYQNGLPVDINDCALGSNYVEQGHAAARGVFAELSGGDELMDNTKTSENIQAKTAEDSSDTIPLWPLRLGCCAASFALCAYYLTCCIAMGTFHMLARHTIVNLPGVLSLAMALAAFVNGLLPVFSKKKLAACIIAGEVSLCTSIGSFLLIASGNRMEIPAFLYALITLVMFFSGQKELNRGDTR